MDTQIEENNMSSAMKQTQLGNIPVLNTGNPITGAITLTEAFRLWQRHAAVKVPAGVSTDPAHPTSVASRILVDRFDD